MGGIRFDIRGPRMLLCEGNTDCHVILSLCNHHQVPETFKLYSCGSDERVIKMAAARMASEDAEITGVVLDADSPDLRGKWQSLRDRLNRGGVAIPAVPEPGGTIIEQSEKHPRLGIWLMPDNSADGMLEDFCASLAVPETFDYARACVRDAKDLGHTTFKDMHLSKACVHTYLAWQDEPGRPLGQAITAHSLDPKHELAASFAEWLMELFGNGS